MEETPIILDLLFETNQPNQKIHIYQGQFHLEEGINKFLCDGEIFFEWLPNLGSRFSGKISTKHPIPDAIFDLIIKNNKFGQVYFTKKKISSKSDFIEVQGVSVSRCSLGDKSIAVEKIRFDIPNFKEFFGFVVKKGNQTSRNRIHFENEVFSITIDKNINFNDKFEKLNEKGGYISLYSGELEIKKGSITYDKATQILRSFGTFLSFINGRRIAPIFYSGIFQEEIIWTDFSNYDIPIYKYVSSWSSKFSINGFKELFNNFLKIWKDEDDKNFLISAIHWYNEANSNSGYAEGSIIMAQTALELIYNWLLIEKGNLLLGRDSESISASNKIRLLLSHIGMNKNSPVKFQELQNYIDNNTEIPDAPEAIVQIRNAIIHSQLEKRKKLSQLSSDTIHQALQLSLSYIELSILYILDYNGEYSDRCSGEEYAFDRDKKVPWNL